MISKSNYLAITVIMLVILLMFQLTGVTENVIMNTGKNIYADEAVPDSMIDHQKTAYDRRRETLLVEAGTSSSIGLVGSEGARCLIVGRNWCTAQKKEYCLYENLEKAAKDTEGAGFLIVDGTSLGVEDTEALQSLAEQGRHVVVSGLPDTEILEECPELMKCLGILEIAEEEITVEGFRLFEGLLLGGEAVYKDYQQEMPYVRLDDSVTAYAVAQSEEGWIRKLENEDLPAIIWRYAPDAGTVYVVNGDFLSGQMGAGILTGFAADADRIYLYPVVNAQVSVVENYPILSNENREVMDREYGQDSSIVFRDILWPSIVAIYYDTGDALTVTGGIRLDYTKRETLDETLLEYYYEQITKESGEMGISGYQVSEVPLEEKLEQDLAVYGEILPDYEILTFNAGDLEEEEYAGLVGEGSLLGDVNTVLMEYEEYGRETFFSYMDNGVLKIPLYMDSRMIDDTDDFRSRCLQTAYGYYGTMLDVSKVIYPESDEDSWNIISNDWSKTYRPFREIFESFERTTVSEADRKIRNYLALDYRMETEGNRVTIETDSMDGDCCFIMRLHGEEISEMTGGEFRKLEEGWYLIVISGEDAHILLEQTAHTAYYIER